MITINIEGILNYILTYIVVGVLHISSFVCRLLYCAVLTILWCVDKLWKWYYFKPATVMLLEDKLS